MKTPSKLVFFCLPALAAASSAQDARCLLTEGAVLPGGPVGHLVEFINNTAVNQLGGYACTVNSSDGVTTLSHVWGNAGDGPGAPLQTEKLVGTLQQTSFESFFGVADDGTACYSPSADDTASTLTGLDGVWLGDAVVAIEGDPIASLPGKVWRFGSRPGVTADGQPYWVGGIDDGATGADEGRGLFFGLGATVLYKTGDVLAGAPGPVAPSGVDFDFRFSALGTHHITGLDTDADTSSDFVIAVDGALLQIGGGNVQEGVPLPAAAGGLAGENWDNFDSLGINEAGDYLITGDSDGDAATDEFLLRNGAIVHREGDVVDGRMLTGALEGAFLNENGEVAFIWDVEDGGDSLEALYFESTLVQLEGDNVDVTGDGVPDPGATISSFTGISTLTLGPDREIYFTADVDIFGSSTTSDDVECFFAIKAPGTPDFVASPSSLSVAAGGTQGLFLCAGADFGGDLYWVLGSASGTAPGFLFGAVLVPLNPDFYFDITLNKPNQAPLIDTFANLSSAGTAVARWELPAGLFPALAGTTADHAYGVIDPVTLALTQVSSTTSLTFTP